MASSISPTRSNASIRGAPRTSDEFDAQLRHAQSRDALALRVTTAAQAAARDQSAIAAGTPSFSLMLNAGTRATEVLLREFSHRLAYGVAIFAGPGNNGGDAYIVAAQLARVGIRVRLIASDPPRTADAQRAAALAHSYSHSHSSARLTFEEPTGQEQLCIDGLLGTGHRGALRASIAARTSQLNAARVRGATVVALDVPTGVDATSGASASDAVGADCTVTFGSMKRGLLIARASAGRIVLVDIGLAAHAAGDDDAWQMANATDIAARVPHIAWNAHKGTRGHLGLVGGARGMAGAIVLASRAALASGIGLARAYTDRASVSALQQAVPQAIAHEWPSTQSASSAGERSSWGHALAIGPGLGRSSESLRVLRQALAESHGVPVVLDADALTLIAAEGADVAARLRAWCGDARTVVCTPHAGEFARMTGERLTDDWSVRATALQQFADAAQATVLLKGAPTLIATPNAPMAVVPRGSAVLATGGSGDVLTGIVGTLLAQGVPGRDAVLVGATVAGIAAERVRRSHVRTIRGATLDDVLMELPHAWSELCAPSDATSDGSHGVWCELPALHGDYQ